MANDKGASDPTFFIVGSVKCGTTALYTYLREHPSIFLPFPKDTNYFSEDFSGLREVTTLPQYLALFPPADGSQVTIGEASSLYMYSRVALQRIRDFEPAANLIAMLRNPIDLAYSFHNQLLFSQDETEVSFEEAWRLQRRRAEGQMIPRRCRVPAQLQYGAVAKLGEQVERMLNIFPSDQVKLVLFDDFRAEPSGVYEDVLAHIAVASDGRQDFSRVNVRSTHRSRVVGHATEQPPQWLRTGVRTVKRALGVKRLGLFDAVRGFNVKAQAAEPLRPGFRDELADYFHDDIMKLAGIMGRDLSAWLRTERVDPRGDPHGA